MRRIAAVFSSKRDRSDAASSSAASTTTQQTQAAAKSHSKRFFRSISRKSKPVDPVLNTINSGDFLPPSSSSSSSGAPTTPDDDRGSLLKVSTSKVWSPLPPIPVDSSLGSFHHFSAPHDRIPLSSGPRPTPSPSTFEDVSSEESSVAPDLSRPPERSVPQNPQAYLLSVTSSKLGPPYAPPPLLHVPGGPEFPRSCNARRSLPYAESLESTMHRSRLQRRLQRGDLSPSEARSIASFTGRRAAPKDRPSLFLDETAVRVGHIRPSSAGLRKWVERPCFEDRLCVLLAENLPSSGLNAYGEREPRWTRVEAATGCGVADLEYSLTLELLAGLYEDILPSEHSQERQGPAPDTSALVHLRLDTQLPLDLGPSLALTPPTTTPSPTPPPEPVVQATMSTTSLVTAPSTVGLRPAPAITSSSSRGQSYKASPSPLRIEAASAPPPTSSTPTSAPLVSPTNSSPTILSPQPPPSAAPPLKPALKQGVRFVEGEKEDRDEHVPLGYVMRIKQKREEKARFLQAERQRRQHEEARRKHEEEKREWEEERAAWEKEKRAMEEERKKRLYADEVAAARSRRESQRIGFGPVTGEGLATGQWDRGDRSRPARESSASYSRPVYDPAAHTMPRTTSDSHLNMPQLHRASTSGSGTGSPEDSRPNSIYGAGSGTGSRPSSMHSGVPTPASSQQDVRPRERHNSGSRRATSVVSETGSSRRRSEVPVPPLPPMWNVGMHPNMSAPPALMPGMGMPMAMPIGMPMAPVATMGMPMYGMPMDMPLLPPSPPFMQQYGRRSSSGHSSSRSRSPSHSGHNSPTLSKRDLPSNNSSERVNRTSRHGHEPPHARGSSLPRSETASSSYTHRPTHHRAGSGDSSPALRLPVSTRSQTELAADRRSSRAGRQPTAPTSPPTASPRPKPTHSSSLPPNPPVVFSQARSSWALPQSGFENLSRPSGRRQTMIS
ncbi:hypothetical protein GSI_00818 [Ganoderma sinense ZZ0214-1]|uniref:Uncharacterized protein n=1 Tax=Ganoderma sinense ZZ0214-1 TaxID=1077348 RepID=A0A2G8STM2_9APHY|nr:hypothetical protein GSI_00818 [Ganoderma sinense ZZ0214-1]